MRPDPIIAMSLTLARAEHRSYLSNARDSLIPELTAYWLEHAARPTGKRQYGNRRAASCASMRVAQDRKGRGHRSGRMMT